MDELLSRDNRPQPSGKRGHKHTAATKEVEVLEAHSQGASISSAEPIELSEQEDDDVSSGFRRRINK